MNSEVIMNEVDWVEQMLRNKSLGSDSREALNRLARYYFGLGHKPAEISRLLEEFLIRCNPDVNLVYWQNTIEYATKHCKKRPLVKIDSIPITQAELDIVSSADGTMAQRVIFAVLFLAKFNNAINPNGNNWANRDFKSIFSMANVKVTKKRQLQIINGLYNSGHVKFSKVVDNLNLNVPFVDNDGEAVLNITDPRNLGNQYMLHIGQNYMHCQECGLVVRKSSNARKYCPECAVKIYGAR